jgi:acetoin utilization protein AcuC
MPKKQTAFIHSDTIEQYHYPEDCPFKTERAGETRKILQSLGYYAGEDRYEVAPHPAPREQLEWFHDPEYLDALQRVSKGEITAADLFLGLGTPDTPVFTDLYAYATLATGGTLRGAQLLQKGEMHAVFNPSGGFHHAHTDKAGGFCYINDITLAAMQFQKAGKRVFCLDLDAHHGDGTQAAFYENDQVYTLSVHQTGESLYPWTGFSNEIGEKEGKGYNCNIPLPPNTDDDNFLSVIKEIALPLLDWYNPDVIILVTGMDILSVDPLTNLSMTNNAIADAVSLVMQRNKPVLCMGAGGYSLTDAARGWALVWTILCGIEMEEDMYMGLGGVFLGSAEWNAGLRDKRIYLLGEQKLAVRNTLQKTTDELKKTIFQLNGL